MTLQTKARNGARHLVKMAEARRDRFMLSRPGSLRGELTFSQLLAEPDLQEVYRYAQYYYARRAPQVLRDHRTYYSIDFRGYGEEAFHAAWLLLMLERQPSRMLEIGVYRGQIMSLWALLGRWLGRSIEVHGVSPLTEAGDSVSVYKSLDYATDIATHFRHFELGEPSITRAYSTDPEGVAAIRNGPWDVIYIDGGHDEDVVLADYQNARAGLTRNGLIVFDDAALYLPYQPSAIASKGHTGPSAVVRDVAAKEMTMLGSVGHNVIFGYTR
jgi:hypothetical protein